MKHKLRRLTDNTVRLGICFAALLVAGCTLLSGDDGIEAVLTATDITGEKRSFDEQQANDPQSSIGAKEHPRILKNYGGEYKDPKLETMLAIVAGELISQSDDPTRAFDITILNSPTVNAFALPGGYLYITRGLLALANDMSEIAAVLAHEMAHVSANHGIERSKQALANDIATRVASEVVTNPLAGKVAQASARRRLVSFSQSQELQADAISIKVLGKANFDPYAAARFLKSMERYAVWRDGGEAAEDDLSNTHPSTPQRIELARRHARLIGPPGTGERQRERFLEGIEGMLFGDVTKEGFIRGNRFSHKMLGISFEVPENFNLTNRADAVLASGPNEMALRFDAVPIRNKSRFSPETYLKSGWVNGLDEQSVRSSQIGQLPAATGRAEAGDWQFSIAAIAYDKMVYRFILAAPRAATGVDQTLTTIAGSFSRLTERQIKALTPLEVSIEEVGRRDTISKLTKKMQGVSRPLDLFLALNGLDKGATLKPGTKVKLVRSR